MTPITLYGKLYKIDPALPQLVNAIVQGCGKQDCECKRKLKQTDNLSQLFMEKVKRHKTR